MLSVCKSLQLSIHLPSPHAAHLGSWKWALSTEAAHPSPSLLTGVLSSVLVGPAFQSALLPWFLHRENGNDDLSMLQIQSNYDFLPASTLESSAYKKCTKSRSITFALESRVAFTLPAVICQALPKISGTLESCCPQNNLTPSLLLLCCPLGICHSSCWVPASLSSSWMSDQAVPCWKSSMAVCTRLLAAKADLCWLAKKAKRRGLR